MSLSDFLTLATLALAILIATPFIGRYIYRVMEGERTFLSPVIRPIERFVYRVCGIDETAEQSWKGYTVAVLTFAVVAIVAGYVVLRLQDILPLNPTNAPAMSPDLAFNTSVSFETNTNWQNYSGETGASHLSQAAMLAVRNFTSAATGLAIAIALFRGLTRRSAKTLGNYWVDLTRGVLYILLPISIVGALVLVWQGVPQTWSGPVDVTTLQGAQQTIAIGPVASQEWIKEMGNNGGGFFNANSVTPVREPDAADQLARDVRHPAVRSVRADLHVRQVRRQPPPGLDDLRRDGGDPARRIRAGDEPRVRRQPALPEHASTRPASAAWRARRSASVRPSVACSWPSRPAPAPAPSTRGTTAPSQSAASSRCSTWSSARSRRAASVPACTAC